MYLVHGDEPLRRGAEDHGVLAAPAMRIAMVVLFTEQQHASLPHELDNRIVCIKHALTSKVFDFRRESPCVVYRAIDLQAVLLANHEVVMTMARRRVYATGAGFAVGFLLRFADVEFSFSICLTTERNVLADHKQRWTIEPRVTSLEPVEFRAGKARNDFRRGTELALGGN